MDHTVLKNDVIAMSKTMLPQIPFNTLYSYADNLFDLKEVPFNDPSIQKQVDFLKSTKLADIVYSNTDKSDFFTMTNRLTAKSIQVSNRMSSRGELRGETLRSFLDQQKQTAPDETAYDAITKAIRTAEYSDMVTMLRGSVSKGEAAASTYSTPMSAEHFELFTAMLWGKIQEKIQNKELKDDLEPRDIRKRSELQEEIWKGIDIDGIYDATKALTVHLQQIKDKSDELSSRRYTKAAQAASELYNDLTSQKVNLIAGKISVQDFGKNCNQLIDDAQKGELQHHRGIFGSIWHGMKVALNFISFGAVSITPTKSIEKILEMKAAVRDIVDASEKEPDESLKPSI